MRGNMSRTLDYLHGTDIYLYQETDMFRINSDTALLAAFMKVKKGERVLDIGTNNGALLAAASRYEPSFLYGVEIQERAVQLARENMLHLHIDHAEIIIGDVKELKLPKVHVVVCNPPYFRSYVNSNKNESEALAIARHETYLSLDTLACKVGEALDTKGRFYMVHRSDRIVDIAVILRQYRLEIRTLQMIYDENKPEAVGVLIEAIKDGKPNCHVLTPITRYRD